MKGSWKARLPQLKPVRLKPVKLRPLPLKLRWSTWAAGEKTARLKLAGGMVFAGLVLTQLPASPLAMGRQPSTPKIITSPLWQTTGVVRQSIVDLYRARRVLLQSAMAEEQARTAMAPQATADSSTDGASTPPNGAATPAATAPTSAPGSSPAAATSHGGQGKALPRPVAPPSAPVATSAFDPNKTIDTNLEMRVAIARNASSLEVATSVDGHLMDLGGENYCNLPAQRSFVLRPRGGGMAFGDCQLSSQVWLEPGEGGYVFVGNSWYKGRVMLIGSNSGIMAVNFVLMHDYLSSVVGSEMYVTWPLEALKAQAVAARSYALVHHVRHRRRAYDLDNTQRYQAYLGIGKETNTTQAAVAATTGEFISHNGGIVESLYAATDDIVLAAHRGNGMSQTGAMQLASQGYSYAEILGNYYPGTSLSRLVVQ
jgi:stage II sporulation protein D